LLELLQGRLATAEATASLTALLRQVQHDYVALSVANAKLSGMASTLVGVRLIGNAATIFNVGDSRAYLLTGGADEPDARLLSRDHSFLNELIDDGEITQAQSNDAASFMRGLTAQFIADAEFDEFKVNIVTHVMQPGERLLLCSDGLNEVLSDTEIAKLLVGNSVEDLLNACKASRRGGGTDDFSVIALTHWTDPE
jgi:protein phosphatase